MEKAFNEIRDRCVQLGKDCGEHLGEAVYKQMKQCAVGDIDDDDLTECTLRLQEILILSSCMPNGKKTLEGKNCQFLLERLVFEEPISRQVVAGLALIQWQKMFIKSVEWPSAEQGYGTENNGTFYLQPYRDHYNATYGRIAYGHRVTDKDLEQRTFVGGISLAAAHKLLEQDHKAAIQTAMNELGSDAFNAMSLRCQAIASDVAFSHGSTKEFGSLMRSLLRNQRKSIKNELLKKPQDPRFVLLYRELIKKSREPF